MMGRATSRWSLPKIARKTHFMFLATSALLLLCGATLSTSFALEYRSYDGTNNNEQEPAWGSANTQMLRSVPPRYDDEYKAPAGINRPNVRNISNTVAAQTHAVFNDRGATDMLWQWGQFIDHDIDLTTDSHPTESFNIQVPEGDPFFDPQYTGTQEIPLARSVYDPATGTDASNPRQQLNQITAFLDGSMVYGSDSVRARALRTNDGTGRLTTSTGNFLPLNTDGLPNAGGLNPALFLAGDVRANEQVGLTAMHTLFMREHNRIAKKLRDRHPHWSGEQIYQRARRKVGALIQVITYNEFLPVLLGPHALTRYRGYDASVNPGISNIFSTAAYRLGHSMLSPQLLRLKKNGRPTGKGPLALRDAFFAPWRIPQEGGIAPLLRGLAAQRAQRVDALVIDDIRNFLFGAPGAGGLDLASLNLQRGRDHGLGNYNDARLAYGLPPALTFADITQDATMQHRLASVYGTVEYIDVWMGGLAEDHHRGAMVGELFFTILADQFQRLRDGDRFFYRNVFSPRTIKKLETTTLSKIIRRNTPIGKEIQSNVFLLRP